MKQRRFVVFGAAALASALALTACSGGDDAGSDDASSTPLTIFNTEPENPLIPSSTNEVGGSNVIQAVFAGLVKYNPDTAAPELNLAESIESTDQTVWTVKLKPGQKFQDGTDVTSDSYINAWNWAAYAPNAALNSYFFAPIAGYDDLQSLDPDEDGPKEAPEPKAKTMSGLAKVSDTEFTVTMSAPLAVFTTMVGYQAFYPLPASFYDDPEAFGKKPVGNGAFQFVSGDGKTGFTLKKWDGYQGLDKPAVTDVQFKTYTSPEAGYADLIAGNLDFMDQVPPADLVDDQYKQDLPDRNIDKPVGTIGTISLPYYDPKYKDPNVGKALSLAIDREAITTSIFNGGRTPATGWVSPIVDGYKAGACGEFCTFDPVKAKEYLAKASFKGPFSFSTNFDGPGNKEVADAICNSIKKNLGADCTTKSYVDFGTFRTDVNDRKMESMFRTSWVMDYPSIQNFLEPLYVTGASSNDGLYSNKEFDAAIKEANAQEGAEALATYQTAEAMLAETMSVIPLWYFNQQSGWSERLDNVHVTPQELLDLSRVTLK